MTSDEDEPRFAFGARASDLPGQESPGFRAPTTREHWPEVVLVCVGLVLTGAGYWVIVAATPTPRALAVGISLAVGGQQFLANALRARSPHE